MILSDDDLAHDRPPENLSRRDLWAELQGLWMRRNRSTPERINGALFSFAAFLTTLSEPVTLGANIESTLVVELLKEWAEKHDWDLNEADVMNWNRGMGMEAMREAVEQS